MVSNSSIDDLTKGPKDFHRLHRDGWEDELCWAFDSANWGTQGTFQDFTIGYLGASVV
jgi:hypothetical protein